MATSKTAQQLQKRNKNTIETGSNSTGDLPRALINQAKDQFNPMGEDFFSQLLGLKNYERPSKPNESNDLKPGEEVIFSAMKKQEQTPAAPKAERRAAHINYFTEISRSSERGNKKELREIQQRINEITVELQRLISSSSKAIQMEYGHHVLAQTPTVGKYHVDFLTYLLSVIKDARIKVENAASWIAQSKGKGRKKGNLLADAQKSGNTSVSLSNERSIATQTG